MVKITAIISPDWQTANARAVQNGKAGRRAVRVADYTYRVPSAHSDEYYTVQVHSIIRLEATCSCIHGSSAAKGVCWHKSAAIAAAVSRIAEVERLMDRFRRP